MPMRIECRCDTKYNLGLFKESIKDYDKAVELGINESSLYNNRGLAKISLGLYKDAIKYYETALLISMAFEKLIIFNKFFLIPRPLGFIILFAIFILYLHCYYKTRPIFFNLINYTTYEKCFLFFKSINHYDFHYKK